MRVLPPRRLNVTGSRRTSYFRDCPVGEVDPASSFTVALAELYRSIVRVVNVDEFESICFLLFDQKLAGAIYRVIP